MLTFPLEDPSTLQVLTSDVYAKVPLWTQNDRVKLSSETEAAFIYGQTNRPYLDETFEDGATIQAFGAVARLNYAPTESLNLKFEGGYASGDQDARDDVYRVFTFHSDYQIGMVLFDQVMPMLTARSVDRIHDPELIQQAPASTRFLVNQGALRNARYLYPVIGYRPIEGLELKLAYLMAFSAAGAIDPFQSGINGGYNLGFDGEPTDFKEFGARTLSWRSLHGQCFKWPQDNPDCRRWRASLPVPHSAQLSTTTSRWRALAFHFLGKGNYR